MSKGAKRQQRRLAAANTERGKTQVALRKKVEREKAQQRKLRKQAAQRRRDLPNIPPHLPGLMEVHDKVDLKHWRTFQRAINAVPHLAVRVNRFREEVRNECKGPHRPRMAGDFFIAYLAFTISEHVDIMPFYTATDDETWRRWGYVGRPSYHTVYRQFVAMEKYWEQVCEIAGLVIAHACGHSDRIGQLVHFDGTPQMKSAPLYHMCKEGECPTGSAGHGMRDWARGSQRRERRGNREETLTPNEASAAKHASQEPDEWLEEVDDPNLVEDLRALMERKLDHEELDDGWVRFRSSTGHVYETRDPFASIRHYVGGQDGKTWHGKLQVKLVDHFTGAVLGVADVPAHINESRLLKPMLRQVMQVIGRAPLMVTTDSAHWFAESSEWLAKFGSQHVGGYRDGHTWPEHFDDTGHGRCEHCGGPATHQWYEDDEYPVNVLGCTTMATPRCRKTFRRAVSAAPRLLGPIPATKTAWQYAARVHSISEQVNKSWRSRYRSACKHYENIPKRVSQHVATLRAQFALLVEWLSVCLRMGWICIDGFSAHYEGEPVVHVGRLEAAKAKLAEWRLRGLDKPIGKVAHELGIGPLEHPPPLEREAQPA